MERISFIIPCYRSCRTVESVVREIQAHMSRIADFDYEIILVNDGSPDDVWQVILGLCENARIIGVDLTRNFGQPSAVMAGLSVAGGDYILTLDDDGQSPADAIYAMIQTLKDSAFDVVYGVCKEAKFSVFRKTGSKINGLMAASLVDRPKGYRIISLCILKRFVADEILKYKNPYPYMSGLVYRTTRNVGYLPVEHRGRKEGKSGYTLGKLIGLWMNGFTAFSVKPLRAASVCGFILAFFGVVLGGFIVANAFFNSGIVAGWSVVISVMLILNGVMLMFFGLIGEYIGRIYMSINNSPQYVIRDIVRRKDDGAERK